jgi:hypothetical protein
MARSFFRDIFSIDRIENCNTDDRVLETQNIDSRELTEMGQEFLACWRKLIGPTATGYRPLTEVQDLGPGAPSLQIKE